MVCARFLHRSWIRDLQKDPRREWRDEIVRQRPLLIKDARLIVPDRWKRKAERREPFQRSDNEGEHMVRWKDKPTAGQMSTGASALDLS